MCHKIEATTKSQLSNDFTQKSRYTGPIVVPSVYGAGFLFSKQLKFLSQGQKIVGELVGWFPLFRLPETALKKPTKLTDSEVALTFDKHTNLNYKQRFSWF